MVSLKVRYQYVLRFENFDSQEVWFDSESFKVIEFKLEMLENV